MGDNAQVRKVVSRDLNLMPQRKKLIEVSLPLDAINAACRREKSIRHGHPSTLHLWWSRKPLAVARAVIFAQMLDDPSSCLERFPTEGEQQRERKRLFEIIEELVRWENSNNEVVLEKARAELRRSWRRTCADNASHPQARELFDPEMLPAFHDPFAGGGALPLEAQRLGLEAQASDLNPVAVLMNKAMIEIPPKFAGLPPVNPGVSDKQQSAPDLGMEQQWLGAQGLTEDVRYYGQWMRDEAEKRIGHLYPKVRVTPAMVVERPGLESCAGRELTVIAWIWARTVKSPNPAFADVEVPLASTFMLSTKKGGEAYVEPLVGHQKYDFLVKEGLPDNVTATKAGTSAGKRHAFRCLMSGDSVPYEYIREEGRAGRMGSRLMAVVCKGDAGRYYLPPTEAIEAVARTAQPEWSPELSLPEHALSFRIALYGLKTYADLFTPRQLVLLTTLADMVGEVRYKVLQDCQKADADGAVSVQAGISASKYADAVALYLAFVVDKLADYGSSICTWDVSRDGIRNTFGRQAIPMTWEYAEANPFSGSTGSFSSQLRWVVKSLGRMPGYPLGHASCQDAGKQTLSLGRVISTDPPYYDNIGYADLSDFFYVWLRSSLHLIYPELFATLAVPKAAELIASPYRHDGKKQAEAFFMDGMTRAMQQLAQQSHPAFPVTIYYAFKQAETKGDGGVVSTGWETFLEAVIRAGFSITGTWPMRTELPNRMTGSGANVLASSIVLVCRLRDESAEVVSRRNFLQALNSKLPIAMARLQQSHIAPVDMAQAAIGPGMAVYTSYAKVLESDGTELSVRTALALINQVLADSLADQGGDFDADTRWALEWFDSYGFAEEDFGLAETLSKAKNTSITGLEEAGILRAKGGKVKLLAPAELSEDWDPATEQRLTIWEIVHHLIRALASGESAAADIYAGLGANAETARELTYRLYAICEKKKRAEDALSYNKLVQSWSEIARLATELTHLRPEQGAMNV